jgi:hypothetical protein
MSNACFRWLYQCAKANDAINDHEAIFYYPMIVINSFLTYLLTDMAVRRGPNESVSINYIVIANTFFIISKVRGKYFNTIIIFINLIRAITHVYNDFNIGNFDGIFAGIYELLLFFILNFLIWVFSHVDVREVDVKDFMPVFGIFALASAEIPRAIYYLYWDDIESQSEYSTLAAWCLFSINCQILYYICEFYFKKRIARYLKEDLPMTCLLIVHGLCTMAMMCTLVIDPNVKSLLNWVSKSLWWSTHTLFSFTLCIKLTSKVAESILQNQIGVNFESILAQIGWRAVVTPKEFLYFMNSLTMLEQEISSKKGVFVKANKKELKREYLTIGEHLIHYEYYIKRNGFYWVLCADTPNLREKVDDKLLFIEPPKLIDLDEQLQPILGEPGLNPRGRISIF